MELFKLLGTIAIENQGAVDTLDDTAKKAGNTSGELGKLDKSAKDVAGGGFTILKSAAANLISEGFQKLCAVVGQFVADGAGFENQMEQYQTSFETMTGSAEKASEVVEKLKKIGAETPFEMTDLANTTQLLMNYGFSADDAIDKMRMLGDISQGSADKISSIATAYGQMSSAGKVSLEDVKQMIEAGFNPLQEISNTTGESMGSLYDRISKGKLSVDEITDSMIRSTSEGGKYFGSMDKQSETFLGRLSTLKDTANEAIGKVLGGVMQKAADEWFPALTDAIADTAENGIPLIQGLIDEIAGIVDGVWSVLNGETSLADFVAKLFQNIQEKIATWFPKLVNIGSDILTNLGTGIKDNLPSLASKGLDALEKFADMIAENLPVLLKAGLEMIQNLAKGIMDSLPTLIEKVPTIVSKFANVINDNAPTVLKAGFDIIVTIGKGLINAIPTLIANVPKIIQAIVDVWEAMNWMNLGKKLVNGITSGIKSLKNKVAEAGKGIVDTITTSLKNLPSNLATFAKNSVTKFASTIKSMASTIAGAAKTIFNTVVNNVKALPSKLLGIGKDLVKGLWNGISDMTGWILNKIKSFGDNVLNGLKDFFGIHSPSRVMRDQVGSQLVAGIAEGIDESTGLAEDAMDNMSNKLLSKGKVTTNYEAIGNLVYNTSNAVTTSTTPQQVEVETSGQSMAQTMEQILEMLTLIYQKDTTIRLNEREFGRAVRTYA